MGNEDFQANPHLILKYRSKKFETRNSSAEFLIFMAEGKEDGVEVMYADETIWCTQDAIAQLFDKGRSTITEHLSNIFKEAQVTGT